MSNDSRLFVLITGGAGFLSAALVRELRQDDSSISPAEIRLFDIKLTLRKTTI